MVRQEVKCFVLFFSILLYLSIVLPSSGRRRKSKTTTSKKEEKLLRQLRQITQLMEESRIEVASPEMEAEEVPYGADWEGTCRDLTTSKPQIATKYMHVAD